MQHGNTIDASANTPDKIGNTYIYIIGNHVGIPTPQRVAAGLPVEVSVGVVTKSNVWRRDQSQQGRCFLVQC